MKKLYSYILLTTIFVIFSTTAYAQDHILWASTGQSNEDGGGRIYVIIPDTQQVILIGNTGLDRTGALAFDHSGNLYTADGASSGPADLYMVSKFNASVSFVGSIGNDGDGVAAIDFDSSGSLYGTLCCSPAGLAEIDPTNGDIISSVPLNGSGNAFVAGLAFDSSDNLFGSRGNAGGRLDDFVSINMNTGDMNAIGGMEAVISDIWFADDGTLYGGSPTGELYAINPISGVKTFLFNTGIRISGLTGGEEIPPRNVPTLSEWGLIALAAFIGIAGFMVIRKRNVTA